MDYCIALLVLSTPLAVVLIAIDMSIARNQRFQLARDAIGAGLVQDAGGNWVKPAP